MEPDLAGFIFFFVILIIFFVAFFLARIRFWSSLVLALIIATLAISILCPLSTFDLVGEHKHNTIMYGVLYFLTIIIILLYILITAINDKQYKYHSKVCCGN